MERRLVVTLGIAALAHATVWGFVRAPARVAPSPAPDDQADVLQLVATDPITAEAPRTEEPPALVTMPHTPTRVHGSESKLIAIAVPTVPPIAAPGGAASDIPMITAAPPEPSGGAAPKAFPSLIALGSPGSHAVIFPSTLGSASEPTKEVAAAKKLDAQLKSAVDAKDTENGSGFGGPVVSAAHAAAGQSGVLGWATFDVSTDALGKVTRVRLVDFGGDEQEWKRVATGLDQSMAGRPLKVPGGAAGVSVRVKVEASMKLPSGAKKPLTPFIGAGSVGAEFDVADIGAKPKRMVSVHIVSESRI